MAVAFEVDGAARLAKVLDLRRRELHETTRQACVAIAVQTLRGVRVRSKVASAAKNRISARPAPYAVAYSARCHRGFLVDSRGKCVGSKSLHPVWAGRPTSRAHGLKVFHVENAVNAAEGKVYAYTVVAKSAADARAAVREIARRRVKGRRGLARAALGQCMHALAVQTGLGAADAATAEVKRLAAANARAKVEERGFGSGEVAVRVRDALRYAAKALKNGRRDVDDALAAAMNKTVGLVVHHLRKYQGREADAAAIKAAFLGA